jgi:hypothetical protein
VEKVIVTLGIRTESKDYRKNFTKAYRVLYNTGLCYLIEILDSAQEAFPFLWVNSEKYSFSPKVLAKGQSLYLAFNTLKEKLIAFPPRILSKVSLVQATALQGELE